MEKESKSVNYNLRITPRQYDQLKVAAEITGSAMANVATAAIDYFTGARKAELRELMSEYLATGASIREMRKHVRNKERGTKFVVAPELWAQLKSK